MSNISDKRERMKERASTMHRREVFEIDGEKFLAIGLMSGLKNRLGSETGNAKTGDVNLAKFNPRLIAHCIHDPDTERPIWNANDLNDLNEIDALPSEMTDPMLAAAARVCGWGKDAVNAGKPESQTPITNSDSSSPDA
jgi:hypothetical protein